MLQSTLAYDASILNPLECANSCYGRYATILHCFRFSPFGHSTLWGGKGYVNVDVIHNQARVNTFRQKAAANLKTIADLEPHAKDDNTRHRLRLAQNTMSDIDGFFLARIEREERTAEQETRWLEYTRMALVLGELQLAEVQDALAPKKTD
jgi:hypothetical protein